MTDTDNAALGEYTAAMQQLRAALIGANMHKREGACEEIGKILGLDGYNLRASPADYTGDQLRAVAGLLRCFVNCGPWMSDKHHRGWACGLP